MVPDQGHLDPQLEPLLPGGLTELWEAAPSVFLRAVPGRETFLWPDREDATLVVKRYGVDLVRDRWYDRLHGRGGRSPARREFENLEAMTADGLPVPRPLGWAESAGRSLLVMARVPHAMHLRERLLAGDPPDRWQRELVDHVATMHRSGWYHRDLYLQHWIPGPDGLTLLDVGRARREARPRERWFVKDLAALQHSLPAAIGVRASLRFLAGYAAARGLDRVARRQLARRVQTRVARMGRHLPRYDGPEEGA